MPLIGLRRIDALASSLPRRRPWRLRLAALISLVIHVVIGLLLIVTIRREEKPEQLPPPADVTMLFERGNRTGPTLPNPALQASPQALPTPPAPPAVQPPATQPLATQPLATQPPVPVPPVPVPPVPVPPVTQPPVLVPPVSQPPPAQPPVFQPPMVPPPPAELSPPAVLLPPIPLPPQPQTPPAQAVPIPPPPQRVNPPAVPPPLVRPPPRQAAPAKPPDFPAPMNFSFGKPFSAPSSSNRAPSSPHIPGTIDMSLGPASKGTADPTPFGAHDEDAAGADWRNALSRWVADHAYYPEQALRESEEGDAMVHVVAEPNGRVKEVELIGKSGSMWLDLALLALFRDQHIPPLPYGMKEPFDFDFTMHYILIRPR